MCIFLCVKKKQIKRVQMCYGKILSERNRINVQIHWLILKMIHDIFLSQVGYLQFISMGFILQKPLHLSGYDNQS